MKKIDIKLNKKIYYTIKFEEKRRPTFEIKRLHDGAVWNITNVFNYHEYYFGNDEDCVVAIWSGDKINPVLFVGSLIVQCPDHREWCTMFDMFTDGKKNKILEIKHLPDNISDGSGKIIKYVDCSTMKFCEKPSKMRHVSNLHGECCSLGK